MAIITIKRKTVIIFLSIVLAAIVAGATAATVIVSVRADNGITIVLDAGHGGADGGVVGAATGTKESDINLSITKYLKKYLQGGGYNVVLTRSDGGAVGKGIKYNKKEDMRARREIVESAAPDLVISILQFVSARERLRRAGVLRVRLDAGADRRDRGAGVFQRRSQRQAALGGGGRLLHSQLLEIYLDTVRVRIFVQLRGRKQIDRRKLPGKSRLHHLHRRKFAVQRRKSVIAGTFFIIKLCAAKPQDLISLSRLRERLFYSMSFRARNLLPFIVE